MPLHPAVPVLVAALSAVALLRRGEDRVAWLTIGLAATAALLPTLIHSDGIPGPASLLAAQAPWLDLRRPGDLANPQMRDVVVQFQPWLLFLREELRAGRLPFWNPYQLGGIAFWSNGQSAPLFPLHGMFAALPVQLGLTVLPWLRLFVAGLGARAWARELGASGGGSLLAGVSFALSGMATSFALCTLGSALALAPWILLATERLAAGASLRRWRSLAALAALQILAGHPETAILTSVLSGVYLLGRGHAATQPRWQTWGAVVAAWGSGLLVSGAQTVPMLAAILRSAKWDEWTPSAAPPLATVLSVMPRLVLPNLFGDASQGTWWGPFNGMATAVFVGATALPLACLGFWSRRADPRVRGLLAMLVVAFVTAYHLPGLHQIAERIPLLGRVALHRMILGIELGLSVAMALGATCLTNARRPLAEAERRALRQGGAATVALLGITWTTLGSGIVRAGLVGPQLAWTAWVAVAALALDAIGGAPSRWRTRALAALVVATTIELSVAAAPVTRASAIGQLAAPFASLPELRSCPGRVAATGDALRVNTAMVLGLRDLRGDETVMPRATLQTILGFSRPDGITAGPIADWANPWLDRYAVHCVLTGPDEDPPRGAQGWTLRRRGDDARIWQRPSALPLVRWDDGTAAELEVIAATPGRWSIDWRSPSSRQIVIAENFDPGWRARLDGAVAPVHAVDGVLMGVSVGPGQGRLDLVYRPEGIELGVISTLVGFLLLIAAPGRSLGESLGAPRG